MFFLIQIAEERRLAAERELQQSVQELERARATIIELQNQVNALLFKNPNLFQQFRNSEIF